MIPLKLALNEWRQSIIAPPVSHRKPVPKRCRTREDQRCENATHKNFSFPVYFAGNNWGA